MKFTFSLVLWLSVLVSVLAQEKVEYHKNFNFEDGIYLSFEDFKNNNPIPKTHLVNTLDIRAVDYLDKAASLDTIVYYDNLFEERRVSSNKLWGYSKGGKIFVGYMDRDFESNRIQWHPLIFIGAYSYYTALSTITRQIPPSTGYRMAARGTILDDGATFSDPGMEYHETVPIQLLLDFSDGRTIVLAKGELTSVPLGEMEDLLKPDQMLLDEFQKQTKRRQKQSSMFFVRRFNERNPIHFPE